MAGLNTKSGKRNVNYVPSTHTPRDNYRIRGYQRLSPDDRRYADEPYGALAQSSPIDPMQFLDLNQSTLSASTPSVTAPTAKPSGSNRSTNNSAPVSLTQNPAPATPTSQSYDQYLRNNAQSYDSWLRSNNARSWSAPVSGMIN